MKFLRTTIFSLLSATAVNAEVWPTSIADIGCVFEFEERGRHTSTLEVIAHNAFPTIRVQQYDKNGEAMTSMSSLVDGKAGRNTFSLFCGDNCWARDTNFEVEQATLFPLAVGNTLRFERYSVPQSITVTEQRSSPYFADTTEFKIVTDIELGGQVRTAFWVWWNLEVGFYTERNVVRNLIHEKLVRSSCQASGS